MGAEPLWIIIVCKKVKDVVNEDLIQKYFTNKKDRKNKVSCKNW